jgi:hypothetical protein
MVELNAMILHFPEGYYLANVDKIPTLVVLEHNHAVGASDYLTSDGFIRSATEVYFYRFIYKMLRNRLV